MGQGASGCQQSGTVGSRTFSAVDWSHSCKAQAAPLPRLLPARPAQASTSPQVLPPLFTSCRLAGLRLPPCAHCEVSDPHAAVEHTHGAIPDVDARRVAGAEDLHRLVVFRDGTSKEAEGWAKGELAGAGWQANTRAVPERHTLHCRAVKRRGLWASASGRADARSHGQPRHGLSLQTLSAVVSGDT